MSGGSNFDLASTIVESAREFAIVSTDIDGCVTSWNPGAELILGWSSDEATGTNISIIYTVEDQQASVPQSERRRALVDGRAVNERWHVRKDGDRFWGSGLLMPLLSKQGFVLLMQDRTADHRARQRFHTMTATLPGFVYITDAEGANADSNDLYRSYTGLTATQLAGEGWLSVVHPEDRPAVARNWQQAFTAGVSYKDRYRVRASDGSYRWFDSRALPEKDDDGRVIGWIGTCIDVDAEAATQSQLEQLNRRLERIVAERTAQLRAEAEERRKTEEALRQSQKLETLGQVTGGLAHDFNNLLTIIRSSADLLRLPNLPEDRKKRYVDAIADTSDRAARLTGQLLSFA